MIHGRISGGAGGAEVVHRPTGKASSHDCCSLAVRGFHALSPGAQDWCQRNALCAPGSHQSGKRGAGDSHCRVVPPFLLNFVTDDLKSYQQNTYQQSPFRGTRCCITKAVVSQSLHGHVPPLLGVPHLHHKGKELLPLGTMASTCESWVVTPYLSTLYWDCPSHLTVLILFSQVSPPSVPRSPLLFLSELLEMSANEADGRVCPIL